MRRALSRAFRGTSVVGAMAWTRGTAAAGAHENGCPEQAPEEGEEVASFHGVLLVLVKTAPVAGSPGKEQSLFKGT